MSGDFRTDILQEAGEAIGNVGRRLFRRRPRLGAEEALQRWLKKVPLPEIKLDAAAAEAPPDAAIDVSYRVIEPDEEEHQ